MVQAKDYYKIMGLSRDASADDIKRAYRKLARKYHPDVSKEVDAEDKFKELGEAYEVLKDPEKRAQYDQFGPYWQQQSAPGGGAQQQADPEQARAFEEFINSIFGQREAAYSSAFDQGQDVHARIQISLEEAYHGVEKAIQLQQTQVDAQGRLMPSIKTIQVRIPPGVTHLQQLRLKGQGEPGANGQAGDLYLEIHLHKHPQYHFRKKDIHLDVDLYPWEAALGAEKMVQTLGGTVKVRIPKGAQASSQLRLKGRGLPGNPAGDQYLHFVLVNPESMSEKAESLYKALADEYASAKDTNRSVG